MAARAFTKAENGLWTPQQAGLVTNRYSAAWNNASPHQREQGRLFFPMWNNDAQHVSKMYGGNMEQSAAMAAHLSPGTSADINRMMAFQMGHLSDSQRDVKIPEAKAIFDENPLPKKDQVNRKGETVLTKAGNPKQVVDRAHPDYEPLMERREKARTDAGIIPGSPLRFQSMDNIARAAQAMTHEDPLSTLGKVKISDFGHTIADPTWPRAPIDTHIHDAGMGRTDIPYDVDRGLGALGRYGNFSAALTASHQMTAPQENMGDYLGGIWFHQRDTKYAQNPNSATARKAHESKVKSLYSHPESQLWVPESHGRPPLQDAPA